MIWNNKHQLIINTYIASEDIIEKNKCITDLYGVLKKIIREAAGKNYIKKLDDDELQDCLIHLITKVLPKLNEEKKLAAFQFIYISLFNYFNSYNKLKKTKQTYNYNIEDNMYDVKYEESIDIDEIKNEIIIELSKKINKQRKGNKSQILFLMLMKGYLIENEFDETYLKEYIMRVMRISRNNFKAMCRSANIKTKLFVF